MRVKLFIIGALAWIMLSAQAPQPETEPKQGQPAAQPQPPVRTRPLPVVVVNQPSDPTGYQDPCKGGEDDQKSDLCAQWTAAKGASDAAYYARLQLAAAVIGMIGLIATIYLTLQAVKAAQDSVRVAQDTAKRQLRAYLTIERINVARLRAGQSASFGLLLRNSGETPAYGLQVRTFVRWSPEGPAKFRVRAGGLTDDVLSRLDIGPGLTASHFNDGELPVPQQLYDDVMSGKMTVIFAGVATYKDAFKRLHRLVFRYYLDLAGFDRNEGVGIMRAAEKGNRTN